MTNPDSRSDASLRRGMASPSTAWDGSAIPIVSRGWATRVRLILTIRVMRSRYRTTCPPGHSTAASKSSAATLEAWVLSFLIRPAC